MTLIEIDDISVICSLSKLSKNKCSRYISGSKVFIKFRYWWKKSSYWLNYIFNFVQFDGKRTCCWQSGFKKFSYMPVSIRKNIFKYREKCLFYSWNCGTFCRAEKFLIDFASKTYNENKEVYSEHVNYHINSFSKANFV